MSWNIITYKNSQRTWRFATTDSGKRFLDTHMLGTHNARVTVNIHSRVIALETHNRRKQTDHGEVLNVGQRKIEIYPHQAAEVCDMLLEQHDIDGWISFPTSEFTVLSSPLDYAAIFSFAAELEEKDRQLSSKHSNA